MATRQNTYLERLKAHFLPLSLADNFEAAKLEWKLDHVVVTEEYGSCPCGKEIKEHCYLKNEKNGKETHVGNECVKKFMNINTGTLFSGFKKIQANQTAKPNAALIEYAYERGYLYDNQYEFLLDIKNQRRALTENQANFLRKINWKIINGFVVRRLPN